LYWPDSIVAPHQARCAVPVDVAPDGLRAGCPNVEAVPTVVVVLLEMAIGSRTRSNKKTPNCMGVFIEKSSWFTLHNQADPTEAEYAGDIHIDILGPAETH
jgi:hypothetical protein